ncbi:MAG: dTMP kinase [Lentisphaeria bacterium]|nr:dTMP kinase [Lentisphaeria bacterium]
MESKMIEGGYFLSFEGPECAGKSTQIRKLSDCLKEQGYKVLITREPGGTYIGEEVRRLVKHVTGEDAPTSQAELLLFSASRTQLIEKVILPFLNEGGVVLCDRFIDSTLAYQGFGREMAFEWVLKLQEWTIKNKWPDRTILMDVSYEVSRERFQKRTETLNIEDRFEDAAQSFHEKVRNGFLRLHEMYPQRICKFDAALSPDEIHKLIWEQVKDDLK